MNVADDIPFLKEKRRYFAEFFSHDPSGSSNSTNLIHEATVKKYGETSELPGMGGRSVVTNSSSLLIFDSPGLNASSNAGGGLFKENTNMPTGGRFGNKPASGIVSGIGGFNNNQVFGANNSTSSEVLFGSQPQHPQQQQTAARDLEVLSRYNALLQSLTNFKPEKSSDEIIAIPVNHLAKKACSLRSARRIQPLFRAQRKVVLPDSTLLSRSHLDNHKESLSCDIFAPKTNYMNLAIKKTTAPVAITVQGQVNPLGVSFDVEVREKKVIQLSTK